MWLRFIKSGTKYYAKTPLGEYAFGSCQGLYEWTHTPDGELIRVDYCGADRQFSSKGKMWTCGPPNDGLSKPMIRGFQWAVNLNARLN